MAEKHRTLSLGGRDVQVTEVEIVERSGETIAQYKLSDGSIIRVANNAAIVYRVDGQVDSDGNPFYLVKLGTSVTTVESLKRLGEKIN
jgi:hypothetical protein